MDTQTLPTALGGGRVDDVERDAIIALAHLGRTAGNVATQLARLTVKGDRCNSGRCPIANYLWLRLHRLWTVSDWYASTVTEDGEAVFVVLPHPVVDFVAEFDTGGWPALDDHPGVTLP